MCEHSGASGPEVSGSKYNVEYSYDGILFSHKKERSTDKCYTWMNLENMQIKKKARQKGFPSGAVVKNPPANAGDTDLTPGPGRSHMPQSN